MTKECYFEQKKTYNGTEAMRCTHPGPFKGQVCICVKQAGHCPGKVSQEEADWKIEQAAERDIESRRERETARTIAAIDRDVCRGRGT